jgi:nucleotide-binding universal stress UspA family protein
MKPLALRNIVVATDLETTADAALDSARRLADLSGAGLHVVHSLEEATRSPGLNERIEALKADIPQGVTLLSGPPGANITQEAVRTNADVIVLGRHRDRANALGSTADRVVRNARVSCLILPESLPLPLGTVLVPVDVGEASGPLAAGLTWASALRRRQHKEPDARTRVIALHVRSGDGAASGDIRARLHEEVAAINRELADITGITIEEQFAEDDDVAARIYAEAEADGADLIVLGTRAQRLATTPLGSVSSAVVKRADRPVLLVPPEVWRADIV